MFINAYRKIAFDLDWAYETAVAFLLMGLIGCDSGRLTKLEEKLEVKQDPAYVETNFCTQKADVLETKTKYIFVLDKSGSNRKNYRIDPVHSLPAYPFDDSNPSWATDPNGLRRYPQLIQFLQNSPVNDPDRYYALINFSTYAWMVRGLTTDLASFQNTIQHEYSGLRDEGSTSYIGALQEVQNMITADISNARNNPSNKTSSTYIVIYISDGLPVLGIQNTNANPIQVYQERSADILQKISDIVALQSTNAEYVDSINFFTGYYYVDSNEDPGAKQLLADMARVGGGVAYTFGGTSVIDFSLFQVPQKIVKYNLSEVFVNNRSVAWWNGQLMLDSDGDGLPDDVEIRLGSDPTKADSDGNGVSDFIEYQLYGSPCGQISNGHCVMAGARAFHSADPNQGGCSTAPILSSGSAGITFADSDKDGLNDCEEMVLGNGGGLNNFDTNSDLIPDGLEYRSGIAFRAGTNTANNNPTMDGMNNFNKIKFGLPISIPKSQFIGVSPYQYDLQIVNASGTQDCYKLRVYNVPTIGISNLIRLEIIENTPMVVNRKIYRVAEKRFAGATKTVVINELPNEVAGVWK